MYFSCRLCAALPCGSAGASAAFCSRSWTLDDGAVAIWNVTGYCNRRERILESHPMVIKCSNSATLLPFRTHGAELVNGQLCQSFDCLLWIHSLPFSTLLWFATNYISPVSCSYSLFFCCLASREFQPLGHSDGRMEGGRSGETRLFCPIPFSFGGHLQPQQLLCDFSSQHAGMMWFQLPQVASGVS